MKNKVPFAQSLMVGTSHPVLLLMLAHYAAERERDHAAAAAGIVEAYSKSPLTATHFFPPVDDAEVVE